MAEQDGAATVDKSRFDGLMAAHQKVLAEVRELKGLQAQEPGSGNALPADSQPEPEADGYYEVIDGVRSEWSPPQAQRHNEQRVTKQTEEDPFAYGATSEGYPV
jgi:hypothetical protein